MKLSNSRVGGDRVSERNSSSDDDDDGDDDDDDDDEDAKGVGVTDL